MGLFDFFTKKSELDKSTTPLGYYYPKQEMISYKPKKIFITDAKKIINNNQKKICITDTEEIKKAIIIEKPPEMVEMEFFCAIYSAKIYCHSIIIDKLGDLTKFIISSLNKGHTIDEICSLTQIGKVAINEELRYLIRGQLINEDEYTLTELGTQYGVLLEKFSELSDGIDVNYNVFSNQFENIDVSQCVEYADPKKILKGQFISVLTRNDNYSNSLEIAKRYIGSEGPMASEILNSLYTTVKIYKDKLKYKIVCLSDFGKGYVEEKDFCVKIAIPYERVILKPRYRRLDGYRNIGSQISEIYNMFQDVLSEEGKTIAKNINEEENAENVVVDINTITGHIIQHGQGLVASIKNENATYYLDMPKIQLRLKEGICEDIYIQEICREKLYQIRYFLYGDMEVKKSETREGV